MADITTEIANFSQAYVQIQKDSMATGGVYDLAISKITAEFDKLTGLTASDKAKMIGQVAGQVATNIATSAQQTAMALIMTPVNISLEEAQAAGIRSETLIKETQSAKDLLLKDEQIAGFSAETLVKNAQKILIDNQAAGVLSDTANKAAQSGQDILNKAAQKLLIDRQAIGFDDKKRVDKAKALADVVGLTSNATGTLDTGLLGSLNTALLAI